MATVAAAIPVVDSAEALDEDMKRIQGLGFGVLLERTSRLDLNYSSWVLSRIHGIASAEAGGHCNVVQWKPTPLQAPGNHCVEIEGLVFRESFLKYLARKYVVGLRTVRVHVLHTIVRVVHSTAPGILTVVVQPWRATKACASHASELTMTAALRQSVSMTIHDTLEPYAAAVHVRAN